MGRSTIIVSVVVALLGTSVLLALWLSTPTGRQHRLEINVYAAASLRDVLLELRNRFDPAGEKKIYFNFAGSNVLAQQIVASNQADIFISANEHWMSHVDEHERSVANTRRPFLSNQLVFIANSATNWTVQTPQQLASIPSRHLSIGDPNAVPAGLYAKSYLEKLSFGDGSLWDHFESKVVPAPDVSAALNIVAADPDIIGIVYRTDATVSKLVRIVYEVPLSVGPAVQYFAAMIHRSGSPPDAAAFFRFLLSEEASKIFQQRGFLPPSATVGDT